MAMQPMLPLCLPCARCMLLTVLPQLRPHTDWLRGLWVALCIDASPPLCPCPAPPHTCWKLCTPMLMRVMPSALYFCSRSKSKVPGSASSVISAPGSMPYCCCKVSRMQPSWVGGTREGVWEMISSSGNRRDVVGVRGSQDAWWMQERISGTLPCSGGAIGRDVAT